MKSLRDFTMARVALGRAGNSLPTSALLDFQLAHAQARDAVHFPLDAKSLLAELRVFDLPCVAVETQCADRATYLHHPELGRRLSPESRRLLEQGSFDVVFVIADGLSALAVHRHAAALLEATLARLDRREWRIAPLVVVTQGRVAIGDEIGEMLGATLSVILIGERPGLSSPDSLGVYLTWHPRAGLTDADRNCISNIHAKGLAFDVAAQKLIFLMTEARRRKLSGVALKDDASRVDPLVRGRPPRPAL